MCSASGLRETGNTVYVSLRGKCDNIQFKFEPHCRGHITIPTLSLLSAFWILFGLFWMPFVLFSFLFPACIMILQCFISLSWSFSVLIHPSIPLPFRYIPRPLTCHSCLSSHDGTREAWVAALNANASSGQNEGKTTTQLLQSAELIYAAAVSKSPSLWHCHHHNQHQLLPSLHASLAVVEILSTGLLLLVSASANDVPVHP